MLSIEIPPPSERTWKYRIFEILPGFLSWTILSLPFILVFVNTNLAAFLIIAYLLMWFTRAVGLNIRAVQGYNTMKQHQKANWKQMLSDLEVGHLQDETAKYPKWHEHNLQMIALRPPLVKPHEVIHAVIVATYNESRDVLEPTIQSVLKCNFDMKKVIFILAYEERGGPEVEKQAEQLVKEYSGQFMHAIASKHPKDTPGEVIGKGGNITYAGRLLHKYVESQKISPDHVIVTTLDADNRPHPQYLAALTYTYCICPEPKYISFQPIPMFLNNIWDAPAPMRVIATGNSFWNLVLSLRPHILRNFSSHAQGLRALIDCDFWSVRTIVEDGHQFWRTYFRYDGKHVVYPIYVPIFQDAVLANTYMKTLKAQFIQLRRWAWGASDVAYVAYTGFGKKNKVSRLDLTFKFLRLLEGHVSWATSSLVLAFAAFIPLFFKPEAFVSNQLPQVVSRVQTLAMAGLLVTFFLSLKSLPPKPARYKHHRTVFMMLQWVMLPVTTIVYNTLAALYSQTRLMFGRYLGKFDVTEKAVKK